VLLCVSVRVCMRVHVCACGMRAMCVHCVLMRLCTYVCAGWLRFAAAHSREY